MRELTGKKIEIDEEVIKCDFCKGVLDAGAENPSGLEHSAVFNFSFGYFSNRDEDHFQWDACNECAEEIAKKLEKYKKERESK